MQTIKEFEDKEKMHNVKKLTCEVLKNMIEELIKENNMKIEKERTIARDLRKSKVHIKKDLEIIESYVKYLES